MCLDNGSDPGAEWMTAGFSDAGWKSGKAQLGYGDRDEATQLSDAAEPYPAYYFRHTFEVADPGALKPLVVRLMRDDGAVVYLNGKELFRDNLPEGAIGRETFAIGDQTLGGLLDPVFETIHQRAQRAGVTKGGVYFHFTNVSGVREIEVQRIEEGLFA